MLGPGDVFAGYTVVRAIGSGRWGDLYLAELLDPPRQVVLEILPDGVTADLQSYERFTIVGSGEFQGRQWLEYADDVDAANPAGAEVQPGAATTHADSVRPDPDEPPAADPDQRRRRRFVRGPFVTAVALTAGVVVAAGFLVVNSHENTPNAGDPELNGTYRFVYDDAKQTANGAPSPLPPLSRADVAKSDVSVTAFRSTCTPTGCVATGTKLDPNNPAAELNRWHRRRHPQRPVVSTVWRFADGHWQLSPHYQFQSEEANCLGAQGQIAVGSDTAVTSKSLEPQDDGTLRGLETTTIITNECGSEGHVYQVPFTVTRTGDVPSGLAVNDPAAVTAPPPTNTTPSPVGLAELHGLYRFDVDTTAGAGGGQVGTFSTQTRWWAMRSECSSSQCVATAATIADERGKPSGGADVLRFAGTHWQSAPTLVASQPCGSGMGAASATLSLSLEPHSDGSLRGIETVTMLTNECGTAGKTSAIPIVARRVGDAPTAVVLADPKLFL